MTNSMTYSIAENGLIGSDRQWTEPPSNGIVVPDDVFQFVRRFMFESEHANALLSFTVQKGRELIRVHNYVGLLPLPNGTQLEILPKIESLGTDGRSLLLSMLRSLPHSPFRSLPAGHTAAARLPLWEVFVSAFLDTVEPLVHQGIQRAYVSVERNERFWKGKFQATRQQRDNAHHAERLAVAYDALTADVPANRILKTTLLSIKMGTYEAASQRRIGQLVWALDEVPTTDSVAADLNALKRNNRLFLRYESALRWAEALLSGYGFGIRAGNAANLALLFPMERVFEAYVARAIRTYWPEEGTVTIQESSAHLVDEHVGMPKFKLRPDMLIRQNDRTLVLDTKWKWINGYESGATSITGSYGIDQADLYQLYAYGKKYEAGDLFLIYPANETFRQPLDVFGYDAATRLHVVPFDLTNRLANEVEKLAAYALSIEYT